MRKQIIALINYDRISFFYLYVLVGKRFYDNFWEQIFKFQFDRHGLRVPLVERDESSIEGTESFNC